MDDYKDGSKDGVRNGGKEAWVRGLMIEWQKDKKMCIGYSGVAFEAENLLTSFLSNKDLSGLIFDHQSQAVPFSELVKPNKLYQFSFIVKNK